VTRRKGSDFSRIKPQTAAEDHPVDAPRDHDGRRALFTAETEAPELASTGSVVISCGNCGEDSVLSATAALRHALPSLHLPFLKRKNGSWMHCPACGKHTWVSVQIQLP
jgi:predicted RNA-binding Zn-ribbon protein involved in translation (DUF1610 family)